MENVNNTTKKKSNKLDIDLSTLDISKFNEIAQRIMNEPKPKTPTKKDLLDLIKDDLFVLLNSKANGGKELTYNEVAKMVSEWCGREINKQTISLYAKKEFGIIREKGKQNRKKDTQSGPNTDN